VDIADLLRSVVIVSRLGEHAGFASDSVAYFDRYDAKADRVVRHFVLLHESAKLMFEPWGWKGQWYVDIVRVIREAEDTIRLQDLYIDVIVDGDGPAYRIIDLDDLARTIDDGTIAHTDVVAALHAVQQFLDNHLHRHRDFPPEAIRTWIQ